MKSFYTQEAGKFHLHGQRQTRMEGGMIARDSKGEIVMEDFVVSSSDTVAFAYRKTDRGVEVMTHGSSDQVRAWVAAHNEIAGKVNEKGKEPALKLDHPLPSFMRGVIPAELREGRGWAPHEDTREALIKIFDQSTPVAKLNMAIEDSGYFGTLL